jgi:HK97 family phage major capsid protein
MLRDELLTKMRATHERMATLTGDELVKAKAEFDELADDVRRIDLLVQREREVTHEKEVKDEPLWDVFGKLMRGEPVEDRGRQALALRERNLWKKAGAAGDFRAPGDGLVYLCPPKGPIVRRAEPLGVVSADIADMIPPAQLTPLFQLPLPPAPCFDKATKVPALNGVAVPFLLQTADDPFAGVEITSGTEEGYLKHEDHPLVDKLAIATSEYEAYTIVSDLALRRAPQYETLISTIFRAALAWTFDADIVDELLANVDVVDVPRATALHVAWSDLVDLEAAIPWFWSVSGEYGISQSAQADLKRTLTAAPGYPMYNATTAAAMYTGLNGKAYFLDAFSDVGTEGDVVYGDFRNVFVGVGQDIVFRRTNEGYTLTRQNSTMFAVFAHLGLGLPVGATFAKLTDAET